MKYKWVVKYTDGSYFSEDDGSFAQVDKSRVCDAGWVGRKSFWVDVGSDVCMARRMEIKMDGVATPNLMCYVIGTIDREYNIYPDGRVICRMR